jgi:hypothetical protein
MAALEGVIQRNVRLIRVAVDGESMLSQNGSLPIIPSALVLQHSPLAPNVHGMTFFERSRRQSSARLPEAVAA